MATGSSPLKTLHVFSMKSSSSPSQSSSTLTAMKLKTLAQTFIFSRLYRIARALTKAKSILVQVLKDIQLVHFIQEFHLKRNKNKNKLFLGSFRLHYNWCSSHVMPVSMEGYYDSTWNSYIPANHQESDEVDGAELSGYLHWLEEKGNDDDQANEIDKLADLFIANHHEKFRLEKQESYRRFQEMMARSV